VEQSTRPEDRLLPYRHPEAQGNTWCVAQELARRSFLDSDQPEPMLRMVLAVRSIQATDSSIEKGCG
jgi:hypothetical protein